MRRRNQRRSPSHRPASPERQARANRLLQSELAELVSQIKDPAVQSAPMLSIAEVRVSKDLSYARIFVTGVGGEREGLEVLEGLERASGYLRGELGRRLRMRKIPQLRFELDRSGIEAAHIEEVLAEIKAERYDADAERVADALASAQRVLIASHASPDGDAVGSTLGFRRALMIAGKEVVALNPDPVPNSFRFLDGAAAVVNELPAASVFDVTVVLDCGDERAFPGGVVPPAESLGQVIVIDHHQTIGALGDLVYHDVSAAAVGVMVHHVIVAMGVAIDLPIAEALYTSIISDTGSFRYQNTNPEALRTAAVLLENGVDPWRVASQLYEARPRRQLELLSLTLQTLQVSEDGFAAALTVTSEMLQKTGCTPDMVDGLVNYARGLEGVEVALLLRPSQDVVRVSMRSRGNVDVSQIAEHFGGGGHRNAAGCTVPAADDLLEQLFAQVSQRV